MTRRALILGSAAGATGGGFVAAANGFLALVQTWVARWNAQKPGTVDLGEVRAWEPLPEAWRRVERERRKLLMGG